MNPYNDPILQQCYWMGFHAAVNGADKINCSFTLFSTPEKTEAWERGNKDGGR